MRSLRIGASERAGGRWVFLTDGSDGQSRSALAATRALALAGYRVAVGVAGAVSLAGRSRHCARVVPTPLVGAPDYADAVAAVLRDLPDAALMVAGDAAFVALGRPEALLVDKAGLAARCAPIAGLETPPSSVCDDPAAIAEAADRFGFPIVIKPVVSVYPACVVASASELPDHVDGSVIVQPFLEGALEAVSGVMSGGRLVAVVHQRALRTWPISSGPSCAAVTVDRDPERDSALAALLLDHEGVFQAQFLDGYLIDLNPRVYGSLSLAVAAGVNLAAISIDPPRTDTELQVGRSGVHYRWVEGDTRYWMHQIRAHDTSVVELLNGVRPRRGSAHSVMSLSDPAPQWARLRYAMGKS